MEILNLFFKRKTWISGRPSKGRTNEVLIFDVYEVSCGSDGLDVCSLYTPVDFQVLLANKVLREIT